MPSNPASPVHPQRRPTVTRRDALAATLAALFAMPNLHAAPVAAALPLMRDRAGRLLLDAHLDGRGPFRFLLDTGAAVSALSEFLAAELRLPVVADAPGMILGATGEAPLVQVQARELRVDRLQVAMPRLAKLPMGDGVGTEFDGVLGADLLRAARARVSLSLSTGRAALWSAERAAHGDGPRGSDEDPRLRAVEVVRRHGPLLAVRVRFLQARALDVAAILDTGAQRSVGNLALCEALRLATGQAAAAVVRGAGGQGLAALQLDSPPLAIGAARLPAQALLYADLPVFAAWGWGRRPAMLLGMDLLSGLSSLAVDYRRRGVAVA